MRDKGDPAQKRKAAINITPLVDVVLVLLIIFMVITPVIQKGFDGKLPQKRGGDRTGPSIVLEISSDGALRINRQPVPETELGDRVRTIFSARPDRTLFIAADDSVGYGDVIRILDICRISGSIDNLAFMMD